jgi:hypothetical protein
LQGIIAVILFVSIHKLERVMMARFFRDRKAYFALISRKNDQTIVAVTNTESFDKFSSLQNILIALGGVASSRAFSELILLTKNRIEVPLLLPFGFMLFFLTRKNFFLYVVRKLSGSYLKKFG